MQHQWLSRAEELEQGGGKKHVRPECRTPNHIPALKECCCNSIILTLVLDISTIPRLSYHCAFPPPPLGYLLSLDMHRSSVSILSTLSLAFQTVIAQNFAPRGDIEHRYGSRLERRQTYTCQPAKADVSEEAVSIEAWCERSYAHPFGRCSEMPAT